MPNATVFPFRQRQSGALGAATISDPTGRVWATSEARNIGGARADRFIAVNNERNAPYCCPAPSRNNPYDRRSHAAGIQP